MNKAIFQKFWPWAAATVVVGFGAVSVLHLPRWGNTGNNPGANLISTSAGEKNALQAEKLTNEAGALEHQGEIAIAKAADKYIESYRITNNDLALFRLSSLAAEHKLAMTKFEKHAAENPGDREIFRHLNSARAKKLANEAMALQNNGNIAEAADKYIASYTLDKNYWGLTCFSALAIESDIAMKMLVEFAAQNPQDQEIASKRDSARSQRLTIEAIDLERQGKFAEAADKHIASYTLGRSRLGLVSSSWLAIRHDIAMKKFTKFAADNPKDEALADWLRDVQKERQKRELPILGNQELVLGIIRASQLIRSA